MTATRKMMKQMYKDIKSFENFLENSPEVCKIIAEAMLKYADMNEITVDSIKKKYYIRNPEYDPIEFIKSVCNGERHKEFVRTLGLYWIGYYDASSYTIHTYCEDFGLGTAVQFILKKDYIGVYLDGYSTGIEVKGLRVKPVKGKLCADKIHSLEHIDRIPSSIMEDYNDWVLEDYTHQSKE